MGLSEPDVEEEPFEFDALDFGNLVHAVIEAAVRQLEGMGGLARAGEADIRRICGEAGAAVARSLELQVPVPPARIWALTVARAVALASEALLPSAMPALDGQRSWAEVPFGREGAADAGLPWDPAKQVRIGSTRVTGKVDRVDLSGDGSSGRVIDWKTGSQPRAGVPEMLGGGSEVQRPIYAAAVRQLTGAREIEAGLAYLKGGRSWHPLQDADACLALLVTRLEAMRAAAANGLLLPGPEAGDAYDDYSFALPGDAKERYIREKAPLVIAALGEAANVWQDA
jgi:ATP-dependent helicase/DNAse subunit B